MKRTRHKPKRINPAALLLSLQRDFVSLNQATLTLAERLVKLERKEKRTIGFHTDCYSIQEIGSGEGADDYETGRSQL